MMWKMEREELWIIDCMSGFTYTIHESKLDQVKCILLERKGREDNELMDVLPHNIVKQLIDDKDSLLEQIENRESINVVHNSLRSPLQMNLELTTRCPLRCPQCYCDLNRGEDLPLEKAILRVRQAAAYKVPMVNLSGGETMVYPHLDELLSECASLGLHTSAAVSGYGIDESCLRRLHEKGLSRIFVSLNGSTKEINELSRDGYELAINTLRLLCETQIMPYTVNWVATSSNIDDFPNMIKLCRQYNVPELIVIGFKPDSDYTLRLAPQKDQTKQLADMIKAFGRSDEPPTIGVESCYSQLKAVLGRRFFGNVNIGLHRGCGAGRDGMSVDVKGDFTPCRHLELNESFEELRDYWEKSDILHTLRHIEETTKSPCAQCALEPNCLHCIAITHKMHQDLSRGFIGCEICHLYE